MGLFATSRVRYLATSSVLLVLSFLPILSNSSPVLVTDVSACSILATWQNALIFFSSNYLAHAASVPSPAGTSWRDVPRWPLLAAFLPFAGLGRSISLISRYIACGYREGHLKQAFVSNAVAVVARSQDWEPLDTQQRFLLPEIGNYDKTFRESKPATLCFDYFDHALSPRYYSIHGSVALPIGYRLISPTLCDLNYIMSNELEPMPGLELGRSQSFPKAIISIVQLVVSSITIYRAAAHGDQLDRYGYAAYGLSVFPYTFMSFVNLVCVAFIGEYPSIYILRSRVMKEAEERHGIFHGAIGTLRHMSRNSGGCDSSLHPHEPSFATKGACFSNVNAVHLTHSTARNISDRDLVDNTRQDNTLPGQIAFGFRMASSGSDKQLVVTAGKVNKVFRFQKYAAGHERGVHRFPLPSAVVDRFVDGDRRAGRVIDLGRTMMALPLLLLPYLFIYRLSGFKKGHSTISQRGWMMTWICANQVSYFPVAWMSGNKPSCRLSFRDGIDTAVLVSFCFLLSIAAVGGYVEVWGMIGESTRCSPL